MTQWDDPQNQETRAYRQPPGQYPPGQYPPGQPVPGQYPPDDPYAAARGPYRDSPNNPFGTSSDQAFGIVSVVLALLGGILGVVVLTGLEWFDLSGQSYSFGQTHTLVANSPGATGFASAYFGWLAWLFLVVAVVAGVAASFPSPALRAFRIIGVVVGFAAAGLSFLAVQLDQRGYVHYLAHARIGFYLMVIAYVMVGIGAAIGPRKV